MHSLRVQEEMGAENFEFVYSEGMFVVDDAAAAIRDYASQGYDLVIAHGSQYGSSLQEIAPDFPETSFAWGTTVDTFGQPNIFAYEAAFSGRWLCQRRDGSYTEPKQCDRRCRPN